MADIQNKPIENSGAQRNACWLFVGWGPIVALLLSILDTWFIRGGNISWMLPFFHIHVIDTYSRYGIPALLTGMLLSHLEKSSMVWWRVIVVTAVAAAGIEAAYLMITVYAKGLLGAFYIGNVSALFQWRYLSNAIVWPSVIAAVSCTILSLVRLVWPGKTVYADEQIYDENDEPQIESSPAAIDEQNEDFEIEREKWNERRSKDFVIFGCLFFAQMISFMGPFAVIPWLLAGVPALLTAWLFYRYVDWFENCWSVEVCTALSGGVIQYVYCSLFYFGLEKYHVMLACIAAICGGMIALVKLGDVVRITADQRQALLRQGRLGVLNFAFAGVLFGGWAFMILKNEI